MKGETQTSFKYRGNYSYGLKNLTLKATRKKNINVLGYDVN